MDITDLTVIIISYNTRDLLDECLDSIYRQPHDLTIEVIVVDNASSDGSADMVEGKYSSVVLMRNRENCGFARANNQALVRCRGRFALLLNSDTQIRGDALETLVTFLDSRPDVGIVGPQLLNTNGTLQPSGNRIPSAITQVWRCLPFQRLFTRRNPYLDLSRDYNHTVEVDEVTGAALLVRREVWESIGLLDEQYFFYFEDIDFCIRAKKAGWRVMYVPEAKIVHHWGKSSTKAALSFHPRSISGHFHYMRKIHGRVAECVLRLVIGTMAILKLILLLPQFATQSERRDDRVVTSIEILRRSIGFRPHSSR